MTFIWYALWAIIPVIGIPLVEWLFSPSPERMFQEMLVQLIPWILVLSFVVALFTVLLVEGIKFMWRKPFFNGS